MVWHIGGGGEDTRWGLCRTRCEPSWRCSSSGEVWGRTSSGELTWWHGMKMSHTSARWWWWYQEIYSTTVVKVMTNVNVFLEVHDNLHHFVLLLSVQHAASCVTHCSCRLAHHCPWWCQQTSPAWWRGVIGAQGEQIYGPRTHPCGALVLVVRETDRWLPSRTCCFLLVMTDQPLPV